MKDALAQVDDKDLDRIAAIIQSMTPQERRTPKILNGSRRLRIAKGSGVTVTEVNNLVDRFYDAQKMMKQMGGMAGMAGHARPARRAARPSARRPGKKGKKGPGRAGGGPARDGRGRAARRSRRAAGAPRRDAGPCRRASRSCRRASRPRRAARPRPTRSACAAPADRAGTPSTHHPARTVRPGASDERFERGSGRWSRRAGTTCGGGCERGARGRRTALADCAASQRRDTALYPSLACHHDASGAPPTRVRSLTPSSRRSSQTPWQSRSSSCAWARCAPPTTASSSPTRAPSARVASSRRSASTTRRRTPPSSRSTATAPPTGWASARSRPSPSPRSSR